jgi:hypothetical protein
MTDLPRVARLLLPVALVAAFAGPARAGAQPAVPRFSHVVVVALENESATSTFESTAAPHLMALRKQGLYIPGFYAEGHASLDNYESMFGGVEPTTQGKADCAGQPYGSCIFPASVPTLGALMDEAHLPWKVYSEGMAGAPGGGNCLHAVDRNAPDFYQGPGMNGYATRHNPAPWFDSVLSKGGSEAYCQAHSVDLEELWKDSAAGSTLPAWSFVEPDTCHDGHDTSSIGGCAADLRTRLVSRRSRPGCRASCSDSPRRRPGTATACSSSPSTSRLRVTSVDARPARTRPPAAASARWCCHRSSRRSAARRRGRAITTPCCARGRRHGGCPR